MTQLMTYASVGVDFDPMDDFKRDSQRAGCTTTHHLRRLGYTELAWTRGESCQLYETPECLRGQITEGLGTKNLVADDMYRLTGKSYYDAVAIDTIAMIVNDVITTGAMPITINMHIAAGSSAWFKDTQRCQDLIRGWKEGCDLAGCTWMGGETPTLKGMVESNTVILSGSADYEVKPKNRLIEPRVQDGDAIVLLGSSGIHANGLTMARHIAKRKDSRGRRLGNLFLPQRFPLRALPDGYLTKLPNGQTYGEALLEPTTIYVPFMRRCLDNRVVIHYTANITGHGWRKLMRCREPFVYIIDDVGRPQPLFTFMQKHGPISDEEAYGNLNMSAGFALFLRPDEVLRVLEIAEEENLPAWLAGRVEKHGNAKKVIIAPKNIEFGEESLAIR